MCKRIVINKLIRLLERFVPKKNNLWLLGFDDGGGVQRPTPRDRPHARGRAPVWRSLSLGLASACEGGAESSGTARVVHRAHSRGFESFPDLENLRARVFAQAFPGSLTI